MFLVAMLGSLWKFISYWYFRYLMVTELYMVERWERNTINIFAITMFLITWYLNVNYLLFGTSQAVEYLTPVS